MWCVEGFGRILPYYFFLFSTCFQRSSIFLLGHSVFRMSNFHSSFAITRQVDIIIQMLNLKSCAESLVGDETIRGISGGEKRRLSIGLLIVCIAQSLLLPSLLLRSRSSPLTLLGVEMVLGSRSFFFDEPTNGLDANAALEVGGILRWYSRISPRYWDWNQSL